MAFEKGTVTKAHGEGGLLDKVVKFLTGRDILQYGTTTTTTSEVTTDIPGRDWAIEVRQNAKAANGNDDTSWGALTKEVVLSNVGHSGEENVIIGMREHRYPAESIYGWELNVYTGVPSWFAANKALTGFDSYDATRQGWTDMPVLQLLDSTMTYWIYSNRARVLIVVKVSSYYFAAYLGFGIRLGTPTEYPFPAIAAGSNKFPTAYTSGGYGITRPGDDNNNIMIVNPGNQFRTLARVRAYPMGTEVQDDNTPYGPTPDGQYLLLPNYLTEYDSALDFNNPQQVLFVTEKAHVSMVQNQQSEDVYNDGKYDYRIFQGGDSVDPRNFMAVKEPISTTTSTTTTTTTTTTS